MTDLSDSEIDNICAGYVQNAAKIRYLRSLVSGLHVHNNLRVITAEENIKKHNKYEVGND